MRWIAENRDTISYRGNAMRRSIRYDARAHTLHKKKIQCRRTVRVGRTLVRSQRTARAHGIPPPSPNPETDVVAVIVLTITSRNDLDTTFSFVQLVYVF